MTDDPLGDAVIHAPPNHLKIDAVWMVVSVDDDGNEGVCAAPLSNDGQLMPLIAADEDRLKSIIPIAEHMAKLIKFRTLKLIKLTTREEVREFSND